VGAPLTTLSFCRTFAKPTDAETTDLLHTGHVKLPSGCRGAPCTARPYLTPENDSSTTDDVGGEATALAALDRKLQLIRDRVRGVAEGYATGLLVWGEGGASKR
jgi:hypothetical protein